MTEWQDRRVLVTGAAGFLGANLTHALAAAGAHVFALVRATTDRWRLAAVDPSCAVVSADLLDAEATAAVFRFAQPSIVFHTACVRGQFETPHAMAIAKTATLVGTANVCRLARELGVERLVHFGSSLEYGSATEPLSEMRALAPDTGRGLVKAEETLFLLQCGRTTGVPLVVLRPFAVYGPWEGPERYVPAVMRSILEGTELHVSQAQDSHDFVYIGDVVAASLRAAVAASAAGEIFNVGTGVRTTNQELVAAAERVCNSTVRMSRTPGPAQPVETGCWVADVRKAQQHLGWSAPTTLEEGLRETYRWSAAHRAARLNRPTAPTRPVV